LDFSIMKLLLTCFAAFALFCHVHAGFCDDKSGRYCRNKDGVTVSTWCTCKYKSKRRFLSKSKYKSSMKRDCDSVSDRPCGNGCSGGYCLSANEVCATTTLDNVAYSEGGKTYSLTDVCPVVTTSPFKTWKDRQQNTDASEIPYLKKVVRDNTAWLKANLLPKFYNETGTLGVPLIEKAWKDNCDNKRNDIKQMNCLSYFPKCVNNRGSSSLCIAHCKSAMTCVDKVFEACKAANQDNYEEICKQFSNFGPRGGVSDCEAMCKENQNDFVSAGSTLGSFMSVAIAIAIAVIM